jgi:hypothetical protein
VNGIPPLLQAKIDDFVKSIPMMSQLKLAKFGSLTSDQITVDVLKEIASIVKLNPSEATLDRVASDIRKDDPDSLGDWIGAGDNFSKMMGELLSPQGASTESVESEPESSITVCPLCDGCYEQ